MARLRKILFSPGRSEFVDSPLFWAILHRFVVILNQVKHPVVAMTMFNLQAPRSPIQQFSHSFMGLNAIGIDAALCSPLCLCGILMN
jgi:hypothetical protein